MKSFCHNRCVYSGISIAVQRQHPFFRHSMQVNLSLEGTERREVLVGVLRTSGEKMQGHSLELEGECLKPPAEGHSPRR